MAAITTQRTGGISYNACTFSWHPGACVSGPGARRTVPLPSLSHFHQANVIASAKPPRKGLGGCEKDKTC